MSGLSEVDIRDFERIDTALIEKAIQSGELPDLYSETLSEWCSVIKRMQKHMAPSIPALFKPMEST
jgi:hypothetical protein